MEEQIVYWYKWRNWVVKDGYRSEQVKRVKLGMKVGWCGECSRDMVVGDC